MPRKYLLNGLVRCGVCGAKCKAYAASTYTQGGRVNKRAAKWACPPVMFGGHNCTARNYSAVEDYVDGIVRDAISQEMPEPEESTTTDDDVQAGIAVVGLEQRIAATRAAYASGDLSGADFFPLLSDLRDKLNALQAAQSRATALRAKRRTAPAADVAMEVWISDDPELFAKRREIVERYISQIVIMPLGGRTGNKLPAPETHLHVIPA